MKYFYRSDIIDARNAEEISLIHLVVFHAKMRLIPTVHLLMPQPNYCCIWKSGSAGLYLRRLTEFTISRVEKFPFPDYNLLVSIIPPFNYSLQSPTFVYIKYLLAFTLNSLQGHFYPLRVWKKKNKSLFMALLMYLLYEALTGCLIFLLHIFSSLSILSKYSNWVLNINSMTSFDHYLLDAKPQACIICISLPEHWINISKLWHYCHLPVFFSF